LRRALRVPALATSLRHRFRRASCDSPGFKLTDKRYTSNLHLVPCPAQPYLGSAGTRTMTTSCVH
jgi:hypothetical protein